MHEGHEHEHEHEGHTHDEHVHEHEHVHGDLLYLDCFSGVSGDMLLGALFELGYAEDIERAVAAMALPDVRVEKRTIERSGIRATKVDVKWPEGQPPRDHATIQGMLSKAPLDAPVRALASRVFARIADAESRVHGMPPDHVHFHEVGSVDAIVDVVGVSAGLVASGARVVASPLPLGGGFVRAAHGPLPVPGPATLLILEGAPVFGTSHQKELVTPTGAALVSTVATAWGPLPPMKPRRTGWGAGTWELPDRPNLLRAVLGDAVAVDVHAAGFVVLEANVDDMTPEVLAHAADRAREAGALDVWILPALMKKGRPGQEIRAICRVDRQANVAQALLRETTTLGLRVVPVTRIEAERRVVEVETPWGKVPIKVGTFGGEEINAAPELEACRAIAEKAGMPLKTVMAEAVAAYLRQAR